MHRSYFSFTIMGLNFEVYRTDYLCLLYIFPLWFFISEHEREMLEKAEYILGEINSLLGHIYTFILSNYAFESMCVRESFELC